MIVQSFNCFKYFFCLKVRMEKTAMTPRGHKVNASSVGDNETALFNESSTAATTSKKGIENSKLRQLLFT